MATYLVWSGAARGGATPYGAEAAGWTNAAASLRYIQDNYSVAAGDIIKVHKTHANSAGAAISWTLHETGAGLVYINCVDKDASDVSATGASEANNANDSITIVGGPSQNAGCVFSGMAFVAGNNSGNPWSDFYINGGTGLLIFDQCTFHMYGTGASEISLGALSANGIDRIEFRNCSFKFGATTQFISVLCGHVLFENCAIDSTGSQPAVLFKMANYSRASVRCVGCNFSHCTAVVDQATYGSIAFTFDACAIATPTTGTNVGMGGNRVEFRGCAAAGTSADVLSYYYESNLGVVEDSQATAGIYRTTGGAEGKNDAGTATKYSLKMAPSTSVSKWTPLYTPWIAVNVASTGDKTVSIAIATATTALKTSEVWMEVSYMGEPGLTGTQRLADSPQSVIEVDDSCDLISATLQRDHTAAGSNRTDTTEAWSSNGSDWTAAVTHTLSAAINIAEQGYILCRVGLAKDQDTYVDPKITVA